MSALLPPCFLASNTGAMFYVDKSAIVYVKMLLVLAGILVLGVEVCELRPIPS